jgi:integrating conjugative element protein (TIGR03759 family)
MNIRFLVLAFVFFNAGVFAAETTSSIRSYSAVSKNDRLSSVAQMWGLTRTDVEKYETIMRGPRGNFSPGIALPLALALEEDNQAEKVRYLTIYAKLEYERTRKDLETSRLYDKIFNELYTEPAIDKSILFADKPEYIRPTDRFVIFIDAKCEDCRSKLAEGLMRTASFPNNQTDIFVRNLSEERELHLWASDNHISVDSVQKGAVTLNMMQESTIPVMKNRNFLIYMLRNNSLFDFKN